MVKVIESGRCFMSSPPALPINSKEPSSFSTKWIREAIRETRGDSGLKGFDTSVEGAPYQFEPLINTSEESLAIEDFRPINSHEPTQPSGPLPVVRSHSVVGVLWRLSFAIVVMAGLTFLIVGRPWTIWTSGTNKSGIESSLFWSLFLEQARAEPAIHGGAKLFVNEETPRPMGDAVPLGVSVPNADDYAILVFAGLVKGTILSTGHPLGDHKWWLSAKDLSNAVIWPPPHFVGVMDITVELRPAADRTVEAYRPLRFEWVEAKVPYSNVTNQGEVLEPKLQSQPIHQLSPEKIAALLKRGKDLLSSGDIAAAQLVLRRAAEAGDAGAALALAGTYDPMALQKLQVHGFSPDLAMARHWYEKAKELGSQDAVAKIRDVGQ
jgi:hypothetical protein